MDLMAIRRGLMMGMASKNVPDGYKVMTVINPTKITLGDELFNLLLNTFPSTTLAIGILDCEELPTENATVYMFHWDGTSNSRYYRINNGAPYLAQGFSMTNACACKIDAGATFTVYYR